MDEPTTLRMLPRPPPRNNNALTATIVIRAKTSTYSASPWPAGRPATGASSTDIPPWGNYFEPIAYAMR